MYPPSVYRLVNMESGRERESGVLVGMGMRPREVSHQELIRQHSDSAIRHRPEQIDREALIEASPALVP